MSDDYFDNYDLEYELEGIQKFNEKSVPDFYNVTGLRYRSVPVGGHKGFGRLLMENCTPGAFQKYETVLDFESQTRPSHDHSFLIGTACQIIEIEISRLLSEPARTVGESMLEHLERKNKNKVRNYLQGWLEGRFPTMIGVQVFVLMALRYGLENNDPNIVDFINQHFRENFISLLANNRLGSSLDKLKNKYRNAACHGTRVFSPVDYRNFSILSFGNYTLREWDVRGPEPNSSVKENAVFLNHLLGAKAIPEPRMAEMKDAHTGEITTQVVSHFRKLFSLSSPTSKCHLEIHPFSMTHAIRRDMSFCDSSGRCDFRLNSKINIGYYYEGIKGDVEVIIFDVGTTGKLTVLMPEDSLIEARINWFPCIHRNQFITLTGSAGIEYVFAIAYEKEINLKEKLGIAHRGLACQFSGKKSIQLVEELETVIRQYRGNSWAIGEFIFEIKA